VRRADTSRANSLGEYLAKHREVAKVIQVDSKVTGNRVLYALLKSVVIANTIGHVFDID
jgi:hypothetical protein